MSGAALVARRGGAEPRNDIVFTVSEDLNCCVSDYVVGTCIYLPLERRYSKLRF